MQIINYQFQVVEMPQRYQRLYAACSVDLWSFLLFNRQASKAAARYGIRLYDCRDGFAIVEMTYTFVETVSCLLRWLIRLSRWLIRLSRCFRVCRDGFAFVEMAYTFVEMASRLLRWLIRLSRRLRYCWDDLYDCRDGFAFVEMAQRYQRLYAACCVDTFQPASV